MSSTANEEFLAAMSDWLVTLPHDMKILYEASSDEDLDRPARELAVGAIINTLSPSHLPGVPRGDFSHFCDDVILVRLALKGVIDKGGAEANAFRERFYDFFGPLEEQLHLCENTLGDLYGWLSDKVSGFTSLVHKHKRVADYLDDDEASEYLYEDGLEFQTEYDVDEELLADRLKRVSTVLDALEASRKAETNT